MQLKQQLHRQFLLLCAVVLLSAGLVFATAGIPAEAEEVPQALAVHEPVAGVTDAPSSQQAEVTAEVSADNAQHITPKTKKAQAFSDALEHAEPMRPVSLRADEQPESSIPENLTYLDTFTATAYCLTGTTATGSYTTVGRTLAVNPSVIAYGTHVWLFLEDGTPVGDYYAEDTGSNMLAHPYVIDIYMGEDSYEQCMLWGAQRVLVYVEGE